MIKATILPRTRVVTANLQISNEVLGEEVEKAREDVKVAETGDGEFCYLEGEVSEENLQWLDRSLVCVAHCTTPTEVVEAELLAEGVRGIRVQWVATCIF